MIINAITIHYDMYCITLELVEYLGVFSVVSKSLPPGPRKNTPLSTIYDILWTFLWDSIVCLVKCNIFASDLTSSSSGFSPSSSASPHLIWPDEWHLSFLHPWKRRGRSKERVLGQRGEKGRMESGTRDETNSVSETRSWPHSPAA